MIYERPLREAGRLLIEAREGQRLTQRMVARRININQGWLSSIETARRPSIQLPTIALVARGLGLEPWLKLENEDVRYTALLEQAGRLIAAVRRDQDLTQLDLAKRMGLLTRGSIANYESQAKSINQARFDELAEALGFRAYLQLREGATHVDD